MVENGNMLQIVWFSFNSADFSLYCTFSNWSVISVYFEHFTHLIYCQHLHYIRYCFDRFVSLVSPLCYYEHSVTVLFGLTTWVTSALHFLTKNTQTK